MIIANSKQQTYGLIILLMYLSVCPFLLFSQENNGVPSSDKIKKVKFGLKGGINVSRFDQEVGGVSSSFRAGYHLGLALQFPINSKLSLQPEFVFSGQGGDYYDIVEGGNLFITCTYINIPVMAKIHLGDRIYLLAGPQIGLQLSQEAEASVTTVGGGSQSASLTADEYETFEFGLGFGFGVRIVSGLEVEGRFNLGLTDINAGTPKIRNRVLQLGLAYFFKN